MTVNTRDNLSGFNPKIGKHVKLKKGWTSITLDFGRKNGCQRGHVKIYDPDGKYVDSALTKKGALRRVDNYIKLGYPLLHKPA